jgi:hypothetical protein
MLKIVAVVGAVLVGIVALTVVIGFLLPERHVAARALALHRKPEDVFRLISDVKSAPSWRSDVQEVELLAPDDGHVRYREKSANGTITMEVVESNSPRRMATKIADKSLPFGGTWIFDIAPAADGCQLTITERGEIYNPVFRFVSRFILGYDRTIDTYLRDVGRKFGEGAGPEEGTAGML